jgi:hypothetical protein
MSRADDIVSARLRQQAEAEKQAGIERLARQKAHYSGRIETDLPPLLDSLASLGYPDAVLLPVSVGKTMFGTPKRPIDKAAWEVYRQKKAEVPDACWYVLSEGLFVWTRSIVAPTGGLRAVALGQLIEGFADNDRQQESCMEVLRGIADGIKELRARYD